MRMACIRTSSLVLAATLAAASAGAQATPFLFTVMPTGSATGARSSGFGYYEVGYGERTFEPVAGDRMEHALGVRMSIGKSLTLLARTGISSFDDATRVSPRGEMLYSRPMSRTYSIAAGVGYAREYSRTDVMLARVGVGRSTSRSMMHGNVLFEKPMSGDRDAVDLISTVGAGRRFGTAVTMSVEAVGQDLEGFWDPEEKDGGARLMVGPSLSVAPPTARWQLMLGGGPIVRATSSAFVSGADRPLPTRNGYVIRSAVGFTW
jgi:hypothetical protein